MAADGGTAAPDPRVVRSLARLREGLILACRDRPLDQVSVSDVVRAAGVARATFYLHYRDLDALAVDTCAELVRQAVDALHAWQGVPGPDPPPPLPELLGRIQQRADLYRALIRPGGSGPLGELLHRELAERATAELLRRGRTAASADLAASAVASVFTGVLADWLHGRLTGTPEALAVQVWQLLGAVHAAVARLG
ncbi:TetR/AcrR family transcriptional regulator [Peterkaempfera bronchialis]|uniref:TetR family transcriptional regulator n=1 Tax=Peterkaempfera bronchialis TaxID=2126346 RepID=A0A345STK3_9ACTN|nr:TetR family transcriptional regulator [Peterkaempfera bronchialis]AXI77058.1 TetR family transcriptional regulator [Peterkaempfera bronchialis]